VDKDIKMKRGGHFEVKDWLTLEIAAMFIIGWGFGYLPAWLAVINAWVVGQIIGEWAGRVCESRGL
jgi:hypothetical protein